MLLRTHGSSFCREGECIFTFGSTASTTLSMACANSAASGFSAAKSQSKSAIALLPVHRRHPGVQRLALVDAAADALGERLGLRPPHRHLDQRGGRPLAGFLDQLDV